MISYDQLFSSSVLDANIHGGSVEVWDELRWLILCVVYAHIWSECCRSKLNEMSTIPHHQTSTHITVMGHQYLYLLHRFHPFSRTSTARNGAIDVQGVPPFSATALSIKHASHLQEPMRQSPCVCFRTGRCHGSSRILDVIYRPYEGKTMKMTSQKWFEPKNQTRILPAGFQLTVHTIGYAVRWCHGSQVCMKRNETNKWKIKKEAANWNVCPPRCHSNSKLSPAHEAPLANWTWYLPMPPDASHL